MAEPPRSDGTARVDEERLAHALISRGLLTREEAQSCRPARAVRPGQRPYCRASSPPGI